MKKIMKYVDRTMDIVEDIVEMIGWAVVGAVAFFALEVLRY
jgi:hypothetical protein